MNLLLLFILGGIWGTSFMFIKVIVSEVPPMTLVAGRLGIAAIVMWSIIRIRGLRVPRDRRLWQTFAVLGLLNGALPFSLISWGEQYIPSGLAALYQSMTPIFTILFAHVLTADEHITPKKMAGVLLGFTGVGLLMLPELRGGLRASVWGQLAMVAATISYACATIFARSRLKGQPPLISAAGQFAMGFAYILPMSLLIERPFHISPSWQAIGSWVALAVFGTAIAYSIYFFLLRRTSATFVAMTTYIVPINGLILGALILHETVSPTLLISLALILSGVLLVRQREYKGSEPDVIEEVAPATDSPTQAKSRRVSA